MNNILIDFSSGRPTLESILNSSLLVEMTREYIEDLKKEEKNLGFLLTETFGENETEKGLLAFYKRLMKENYQDIRDEYLPFTIEKENVLNSLDGIYDVWRKKERYCLLNRDQRNLSSVDYINESEELANLILSAYRKVYENVLGREQDVYRQLPSGVNAGFILSSTKNDSLPEDLQFLNKAKGLNAMVIHPPFISSSVENTRVGVFHEKNKPLTEKEFHSEDYVLTSILIRDKVGYIYIHKDYLSFLVALGNLFQIVSCKETEDKKVDFIVVFGADNEEDFTYYYKDNGVYVGVCPLHGHLAYFGYLKKIILTLFNLIMIDNKRLPIHGAGMEITLKNGKTYNLVLLGDSGAGKSETMEALKRIAKDEITSVNTIFDDMGTFILRDGDVMCAGTEIGAFVRLDDLSQGYSLRSVDRAVYLNIERVNSRVVIPIETYAFSKALHKVDFFLLADNFTKEESGVKQYKDEKEAEGEFIKGERIAKGTTSEKGKVSTFFANPFGPLQRQKDCKVLIDDFFDHLYKNGVYVGRLYTKLAIDPVHGPEIGAKGVEDLLHRFDK